MGRAHGPGRARRFLLARLFQRLPACVSVRSLVPRRDPGRRAAPPRGEGREHSGRRRHRDVGGRARVASRGPRERDPRRGTLVRLAGGDLRRPLLGSDRFGRLASALRGARGRGSRPLGDRRSARGHRGDGETAVRHRRRRHRCRRAHRGGAVPAVAAVRACRARGRRDRARSCRSIQVRARGAPRSRDQSGRDLSLHVALRIQHLVDRRRLLEAGRCLRRIRRCARRDRTAPVVRAAVVAPRHRHVPRRGNACCLRVLFPADARARAIPVPGAGVAAPASRSLAIRRTTSGRRHGSRRACSRATARSRSRSS